MDSAAAASHPRAHRRAFARHPAGLVRVRSVGLTGLAAWATVVWSAAGTIFYLLMPKSAPIILLLGLLAPLLWLGSAVRYLRPFRASGLSLMLAIAAIYLLINASWSLAAHDAYRSVLSFIVAAAALFTAVSAHRALHEKALRAMLLGFLAGYAIVGAVICIEMLTDHAGFRLLMKVFPDWDPDLDGATFVGDVVESFAPSLLNRHAAALVLLFWPAVLAANELADGVRGRVMLGVALITPAVAAILLSHHATSKVALMGGALMFVLHRWTPRFGTRVLGAAWILACVAVVPVAFALYANQLHAKEWLFPSARHRVVIWEYTAEKIAKAPILGAGVSTARALDKLEEGTRTLAPGTPFPRETSVHAHDAYLQVWFEAGAVGAALLLTIGLLVIGAIGRTAARVQSPLFATFASHALVAAFGFSIWAPWLLSSFALAVLFASPAVTLASRDPEVAWG